MKRLEVSAQTLGKGEVQEVRESSATTTSNKTEFEAAALMVKAVLIIGTNGSKMYEHLKNERDSREEEGYSWYGKKKKKNTGAYKMNPFGALKAPEFKVHIQSNTSGSKVV